MAHSRHGPTKLRSLFTPKSGICPGRTLGESGRRSVPLPGSSPESGPKRPGMARNGPPGLPISYLDSGPFSGHRAPSDPSSRYETTQMAQNGAEIKKIALSEYPERGENSLAGPRFRPPERWLVFLFPVNLEVAGQQTNGNLLRARPVVPAPLGTSNREKGRFCLVRQLNAYCRNQSATVLPNHFPGLI